jgi:hypothetical protein
MIPLSLYHDPVTYYRNTPIIFIPLLLACYDNIIKLSCLIQLFFLKAFTLSKICCIPRSKIVLVVVKVRCIYYTFGQSQPSEKRITLRTCWLIWRWYFQAGSLSTVFDVGGILGSPLLGILLGNLLNYTLCLFCNIHY